MLLCTKASPLTRGSFCISAPRKTRCKTTPEICAATDCFHKPALCRTASVGRTPTCGGGHSLTRLCGVPAGSKSPL
jgi:hypothetical protein